MTFFRNDGSTLFPEEVGLLGDVRGKALLHLQCNAGQDTLSIASQLGAVVTGVDISDEAVSSAQHLARESGIPAQFVRADLFDFFRSNEVQYDIIFTSYGVTGWLSDLKSWGTGIARLLKPGGRFVMIEFHPAGFMFEADWTLVYDYMGGKVIDSDGVGDYVGESGGAQTNTGEAVTQSTTYENPQRSYEFPWGIADHVSALLDAGLRLDSLKEYPFCNGYAHLDGMIEEAGRRMILPPEKPQIPLMFSITATRE